MSRKYPDRCIPSGEWRLFRRQVRSIVDQDGQVSIFSKEYMMKILVVDDSRAMRRIVSRTIRQAGFTGHDIVEAENGQEALEVAKAEKPDLILSDWHMPVMTGIEFLTALNAEGLEIPFGFVTSESTKEMVEQATEGGAMFLLAKPFTADDMAQVLGAFVS